MKKELFRGVGTAMITPFKDGEVDYASLRSLTEYQISRGVSALVVCGTTGESPTLTHIEKIKCISAVAEICSGKVPIIAGSTSNDTRASAALSREACREGADGVLAVTPYYNRPGDQGLIRHFSSIADACGKPVILYNVPSRTGCDIPDSVYFALADNELIVGVKEASGSVSKAIDLLCKYGDKLDVYSGNDDLTLPLLSLGAKGVISVVSNLLPFEMSMLCRLWFKKDVDGACKLNRELYPVYRAAFAESNPIPIKAAMEMMGFCGGEIRAPLSPASDRTRAEIERAIKPYFN